MPEFETEISGIRMKFRTGDGLFSPAGPDPGTLALLSCVEVIEGRDVLDLGCGYGLVGVYCCLSGAKSVMMSDVDPDAILCAKENAAANAAVCSTFAVGDGLEGLEGRRFDLILSNPPYHVDFSVPKRFIEAGNRVLTQNGRYYMVTKRKEWYKRKFISVFGGVRIMEKDGYFVFMAEKRGRSSQT